MRVGSKIVLGAVVICALGLSISRTGTAQQTVVRGEEKNANVQIGILGDQPVDLINGLLVLQFQDEHRKADLANRFVDGFRKDKASGIPYGTYKARIYVNGFAGCGRKNCGGLPAKRIGCA